MRAIGIGLFGALLLASGCGGTADGEALPVPELQGPLLEPCMSAPDWEVPVLASGEQAICHVSPGNPEGAHTLTVGDAAVSAHLAHGDSLGACETPPPPPPTCKSVEADCRANECCPGLGCVQEPDWIPCQADSVSCTCQVLLF